MRKVENTRIKIFRDNQASLKTYELKIPRRSQCPLSTQHVDLRILWHYGNENADELPRKSSSTPYIDPELAFGVTKSDIRGCIRNWENFPVEEVLKEQRMSNTAKDKYYLNSVR